MFEKLGLSSRNHPTTLAKKIMAALRLVIGVVRRQFPKVPVMTTDELQHLIRNRAQAQRKLVLLVSTDRNYPLEKSHIALSIARAFGQCQQRPYLT